MSCRRNEFDRVAEETISVARSFADASDRVGRNELVGGAHRAVAIVEQGRAEESLVECGLRQNGVVPLVVVATPHACSTEPLSWALTYERSPKTPFCEKMNLIHSTAKIGSS